MEAVFFKKKTLALAAAARDVGEKLGANFVLGQFRGLNCPRVRVRTPKSCRRDLEVPNLNSASLYPMGL